jgi:hypothetical protein
MPSSAPHRVREKMNLSAEDCVPAGGYRQCSHGKCLNHHPEWETIEKNIHIPCSFLEKLRFWFRPQYEYPGCCGKRMAMSVLYYKEKCRKCNRVRLSYYLDVVFVCSCCGFKRTIQTHPATMSKIFGKK